MNVRTGAKNGVPVASPEDEAIVPTWPEPAETFGGGDEPEAPDQIDDRFARNS